MKTIQEIAALITNIRYYDDRRIAFDVQGETYTIRDPKDVVLVGVGEAAAVWIAKHYGFLFV